MTGLKIPTGGNQTNWLFSGMSDELDYGLQRNNSSLVVRERLEPDISKFQV